VSPLIVTGSRNLRKLVAVMRRSLRLTQRPYRMFDEQAINRALGQRRITLPCSHFRVDLPRAHWQFTPPDGYLPPKSDQTKNIELCHRKMLSTSARCLAR